MCRASAASGILQQNCFYIPLSLSTSKIIGFSSISQPWAKRYILSNYIERKSCSGQITPQILV